MQIREESLSWPGHIDSSGRLLLPAESRNALGWDPGTDVVIESDGQTLRILTLDQFTHEVQDLFGLAQEGEPLLSETLMSDRRREARRERGGR